MSKMPAKKKSCFQITSVTQAQVAASSVADDTESLDDPDESRTEDVSSDIFDVTRADYETVCDRSSSEETLNNVGEQEAPGIMAPSHIPQAGQSSAMSGPPNVGFRKVGVAGSTNVSQQATGTSAVITLPLITQSGVVQQQPVPPASGGANNMSVSTSQPAVTSSTPSTTTSATSCSSRFRVIKLDHGTGEPFRRGRWTCMEFYEKDSEGTTVSRTVDSVRHGNAPDPGADRDSGLGFTGGSAAAAPATQSSQGSVADASLPASHTHSADMVQQQLQPLHHQNYNVGSGMATQSTFSSNNKPATAPAGQPAAGSVAPQNLLPVGHNGPSQAGMHLQISPGMLPPAGQAPPLPYTPQQPVLQQLPLGHPLANPSSGVPQHPADFYQPAVMQPMASSIQTLPVASLSGGQPAGQGPSPVMAPAVVGASVLGQVGEMIGAGGGSLPVSQPAPTLLQQTVGGLGGVGGSVPGVGSFLQQQPMGQYAPAGRPQPLGTQNVPAVSVSSGAPAATVPNLTLSSSSDSPPGGQRAQTPPDAAAGFGHSEGSGRKAEGGLVVQPPTISGKDPVKPLIPESLQLTSPSVNSLFGIAIHMDGDDDRNPSMAFYQAFQSGSRLQDSKAHSDSASGASVVAIDNKIEQAMDLVKSHLMYAVREEVEVLKEQIKELFERNSVLERENAVLKSLANSDQLSQLSVPAAANSNGAPPQQGLAQMQSQLQAPAPPQAQLHLQTQQLQQLQTQQLQAQQLQAQQLQTQQLQPQQLQTQQLQQLQTQQLPLQQLQTQTQQLQTQQLQTQQLQTQQLQPQQLPLQQLQTQTQQLQTQTQQLQAQQLQAQQLQAQQAQQPQTQQLQTQQLQTQQLQTQQLQTQQLQTQLDTSHPAQQTQPNVTSA